MQSVRSHIRWNPHNPFHREEIVWLQELLSYWNNSHSTIQETTPIFCSDRNNSRVNAKYFTESILTVVTELTKLEKHIQITKETWKRLSRLKADLEKDSLNDVIEELLQYFQLRYLESKGRT